MKISRIAFGLALAVSATVTYAAQPTIADLRHGHRLLIVSAPAGSVALAAQRKVLAAWQRSAEERDIVTVYLNGSKVEGASDTAATIRSRYDIKDNTFAVALVGKDGHVAYRAAKPVSGAEIEQTIDEMPMRRAGQR